jgi:hypothetical protein
VLIWRALDYVLGPIFIFLMHVLEKDSYLGIRLCDVNFDETDDQTFVLRTKEALDLIRQVDVRRFRRVQKEIRHIVNIESLGSGAYMRRFKICKVDFGKFKSAEYPDYWVRAYACTLVHEATHGAISSHGIPYTQANRNRIERLCHEEERRFAQRLNDGETDWAKLLVREFDESKWYLSWFGSWWTRNRLLLRRVKESRAAGAAKRAETEDSVRITDERLKRIHQKMKQGAARRTEGAEETQGG